MVNYYYYYGLPLTLIFKIFKYDYHPHMNYHPIRSLFGAHRDTKVLTHHIHDIPTIIQLSWKGTWVLSDYTYIYIQIYIQIHIIIFPLYQLTWSCYNGYRCSPAYPHHIPRKSQRIASNPTKNWDPTSTNGFAWKSVTPQIWRWIIIFPYFSLKMGITIFRHTQMGYVGEKFHETTIFPHFHVNKFPSPNFTNSMVS